MYAHKFESSGYTTNLFNYGCKTYLFNLLLKFKNLHKKIFVENWPKLNWTTDSFIKKLETNTFINHM